jgi:putative transposon-encoded protein
MSIKSISSAFHLSRNTVRKYVRRYQESGLTLDQLLTMSEEKLQEMFLDNQNRSRNPSPRMDELEALVPDYVKRLSRKGVTVKSLHEEYLREHPDGYKYVSRRMSGRKESRRELFEEVEKEYLQPLPAVRFQMKARKTVTVMKNSYVMLNKHHYSVPKEYIGKRVDIVYDADSLQIYHGLKLVTSHMRNDTPYGYTQKEAHRLPGRHGSYEKDLGEIYERAGTIDNILLNYLREVAAQKKYLPLAFRTCRGIMSLEKKYGLARLVAACACASEGRQYGYNEVQEILKRGDDVSFMPLEDDTPDASRDYKPQTHKNIRGREYYSNLSSNEKEDDNGDN